jgi:hypothetical protein
LRRAPHHAHDAARPAIFVRGGPSMLVITLNHREVVPFERLAGVLGVVGAEVVDDDDGVRWQLGDHLLGHVQTEDVPVHGSVECARRHDPRQAERHHQRDGTSGVERDRRVGALRLVFRLYAAMSVA